jgi:uncharacterized protein YndB with AHSA1/START domain
LAEINHFIGIRAPISEVFAALTTTDNLAKWWTTDTRGDPGKKGGVIEFRFNGYGPDMEVVDIAADTRVEWKCIKHAANAAEWVGTHLSFDLAEKEGMVGVRFRHSGWREASRFHAFCSMTWAISLLSLKEALEMGVVRLWPPDLRIC